MNICRRGIEVKSADPTWPTRRGRAIVKRVCLACRRNKRNAIVRIIYIGIPCCRYYSPNSYMSRNARVYGSSRCVRSPCTGRFSKRVQPFFTRQRVIPFFEQPFPSTTDQNPRALFTSRNPEILTEQYCLRKILVVPVWRTNNKSTLPRMIKR